MHTRFLALRLLPAALVVMACRTTSVEVTPAPSAAATTTAERPAAAKVRASGGVRPYGEVITAEAISAPGLFTTHLVDEKLHFEVPRAELGRPMLLVTSIARTHEGDSYGGQSLDERVVRWERHGGQLLLRSVSHAIVADPTAPVAAAVANSNLDVILAAFDIEAFGEDSAAVIDVTTLYTKPPNEFSVSSRYRGGIDASRSFLGRVASYPRNVEVEATLTVNANATPSSPIPGLPASSPPPGTPSSSKTFVAHYSMVRLPDEPMMPRLRDSRVGFYFTSVIDYSRPEHRAQGRHYIARWRLEKRDPSAAVSEPVAPITYYIDRATPEWLVPWIVKGVEEWQPAFEEAGFRRAIVARRAPSEAEDPHWSPEDARYSTVRWLASTTENAQGPHVIDPRSGEILESDIKMYHNVMNLQTWWYWTHVGALDPRAAHLPLPDSLLGRLVQFVVAHEVGHTLGFPHNQMASSLYPADSVHSRSWVARMGHSPSIMDYARMNYTARPEDGIPLEQLMPHVGPYDRFAVKWGYTPIPGAADPDAERQALEAIVAAQDSVPWLRFSLPDDFGAVSATAYFNAVGDDDAVASNRRGLANLKDLMPGIVEATAGLTEDVGGLREGYERLLGHYTVLLGHVAAIVGGVEGQEKYRSQPGVRFVPLSRDRQREAVAFLHAEVFETPTWLLDPGVLRRIEAEGSVARINRIQRGALSNLLSTERMARLVEYEALGTVGQPYRLPEFLADIRSGVWRELTEPRIGIDAYRRGVQRAYVELVIARLSAAPSTNPGISGSAQSGQFLVRLPRPSTDVKAMLRQELRTLDGEIARAQARAADAMTRAHLADVRWQITQALDPGN